MNGLYEFEDIRDFFIHRTWLASDAMDGIITIRVFEKLKARQPLIMLDGSRIFLRGFIAGWLRCKGVNTGMPMNARPLESIPEIIELQKKTPDYDL